jgi:hypothetical protein
MRARACTILCIGVMIAAPAWAAGGRYGTDYPVCMEAIDAGGGTHFECSYTSIEQCRQGTVGTSGSCFKNPSYVRRPAEPAPAEAQPEPATNLKRNSGRYGTDYPVCMEAIDAGGGTHFECSYTSIKQCRQGTVGTSGNCFNNPSYVPPPVGAAPAQAEPELPAKPRKSAGRYDPDYPVCMEATNSGGSSIDCGYTSFEQCRQGTFGTSGTCFNNPSYVPPPVEAAPAQTEPASPAKPAKSGKSAKSAKLLQSPPSPQPAQSQQR